VSGRGVRPGTRRILPAQEHDRRAATARAASARACPVDLGAALIARFGSSRPPPTGRPSTFQPGSCPAPGGLARRPRGHRLLVATPPTGLAPARQPGALPGRRPGGRCSSVWQHGASRPCSPQRNCCLSRAAGGRPTGDPSRAGGPDTGQSGAGRLDTDQRRPARLAVPADGRRRSSCGRGHHGSRPTRPCRRTGLWSAS
jgi:hypothetical protein